MKRIFNHQEVKIDQKVLYLYFLQNYYMKEIMQLWRVEFETFSFTEINWQRKYTFQQMPFLLTKLQVWSEMRILRDCWLIKTTVIEAGLWE